VPSPPSSGESAEESSTTRLKAGSKPGWSLEVRPEISAPCATSAGSVTSSLTSGSIGRRFS
jgi:hypothetical protein